MRTGRPLSIILVVIVLAAGASAQGDYDAEQARAEQLMIRGMTAAYVQDHERAAGYFAQVLEIRPNDAAALSALAETLQATGDVTGALFHAEMAVEAAPGEPALHRHLADLQIELGVPDAAVESLERVLAMRPSDVASLSLLARVQVQVDRSDDALATYDRLLDVVGENASVRARMLRLYREVGDEEGARESLQALVELHPENNSFQRELAEMNRNGAATTEMDDGLEDLSTQPSFARASALFDEARVNPAVRGEAIEMLDQLDRAGDLPLAGRFLLGRLLVEAHEHRRGAEILEAALSEEPTNIEAWGSLATAQLRSGHPDEALATVEDALLLFPGQPALLRPAALIHLSNEDVRVAARLAREMHEIVQEDYGDEPLLLRDALALIGEVRLAEGAVDEAVEHLQDALDLARSADVVDAGTLILLGEALDERGDAAEARRLWEEAAGIDPDHPALRERTGPAR